MYEIDYVFDEMSLFHIEELFDILGIDYEIPKRKKKGAVQEYYGKQQMRLK